MAPEDNPLENFAFEHWSALATSDPQAFETARRELIESVILSAPANLQPRLRGLQWQLDRLRELHHPLGACVKISSLMWHQVLGENGLLANVQRLGTRSMNQPVQPRPATILPFARRQ